MQTDYGCKNMLRNSNVKLYIKNCGVPSRKLLWMGRGTERRRGEEAGESLEKKGRGRQRDREDRYK